MAKLMIDQVDREALSSLKEGVEICTPEGHVLGTFYPRPESPYTTPFDLEEYKRKGLTVVGHCGRSSKTC